MNRIIIISALMAMALAVACGGGGEVASDPPRSEPLTTAQLTELLLTREDVGASWKVGIPNDPVRPFCGMEFPATATAEVVITFREDNPTYTAVPQFVQAFPPGEAERAMADGLARIQACTGWVDGIDALGKEITVRVSPISFPTFGDDTLALRKSAEVSILGTQTLDVIYVRRGDLVTTIIYWPWFGDASDIDSEQVESFARLANLKLAALD